VNGAVDLASNQESGVDSGAPHVVNGARSNFGIADDAASAARRFFSGFELRLDERHERSARP
jgi:hypothetical protein